MSDTTDMATNKEMDAEFTRKSVTDPQKARKKAKAPVR